MRVNLEQTIRGLPNNEIMDKAVDAILEESNRKNDPIFISDLLVEHGLAEPILAMLRGRNEKAYKLRCIVNEWGEELKPGDKVQRKHMKNMKPRGKHITAKTINEWKRRGIKDQMMFDFEDFTVDEKGCISCSASDVEYFLTNWGVHSVSGYPISYHAMAKTEEKHDVKINGKKTGQKAFVHYYRFEEIEKADYENLPKIKR